MEIEITPITYSAKLHYKYLEKSIYYYGKPRKPAFQREGDYRIAITCAGATGKTFAGVSGKICEAGVLYSADYATDLPLKPGFQTELNKRVAFAKARFADLRFECPDPILENLFDYSKIRACDSICQTKYGPMVVNGIPHGGMKKTTICQCHMVDYLITDPLIDAKRIAVVGHSRLGKAALLAGAFDERVAIVFPHQSGCGGAAPSRGKVGESVTRINDVFPHWFDGEFKKFSSQPDRLPFDQNCVIALCAPRPVLITCAVQDTWSNPEGQFEMLKAADKVFRLTGKGGLDAQNMKRSAVREAVGRFRAANPRVFGSVLHGKR